MSNLLYGKYEMMQMRQTSSYPQRGGALCLLLALFCWLTWPSVSLAQLDICQCIGTAGLRDFDSANEATYPEGTTRSFNIITIPLPPDGRLIFNNFTVAQTSDGFNATIVFTPNDMNTPVTLLATGNVTITAFGILDVR